MRGVGRERHLHRLHCSFSSLAAAARLRAAAAVVVSKHCSLSSFYRLHRRLHHLHCSFSSLNRSLNRGLHYLFRRLVKTTTTCSARTMTARKNSSLHRSLRRLSRAHRSISSLNRSLN